MGMFDYKTYSAATSAELVNTSFRIATFGQFDRIFGLDVNQLVNTIGGVLPPGTVANPVRSALPAGWAQVGHAALGLDASAVDPDGNDIIKSPLTGTTYSGPQAQIMQQTDAAGQVTRLSIAFNGTNSPVDLPDYLQLNSGDIAPNMAPLLVALSRYAIAHGVAAENVIVTGYSLGAAYANIMAKYGDTLADGFFANSNYVAFEVPYTYEGQDRVLNVGYENDVVHRAVADYPSLDSALAHTPGLLGQDPALTSATDNFVLFDDDYASPLWSSAPFALYNIPGGWSAHFLGITTDAVERVTQSAFYDYTARESLVIVSNLSEPTRLTTWVEDVRRPSDGHDHVGDTAFLIGSAYADRLRGNVGNDYIDGMAGDDTIRPGGGQNRVEGGAGRDTLELAGTMRDWTVSHLADGSTAFFSPSYGLDIVTGVENVTFLDAGVLQMGRSYSIEADRLEDLTYGGILEWLDQDVAYTEARQGTSGHDALGGTRVFGLAGNDTITGTAASDLLYGGAGGDVLDGRAGNDWIYGGEGNDTLTGGGGNDLLNGGLGDDLFVVDAGLRGQVTIQDFRQNDVEHDVVRLVGSGFRSIADVLSHGAQNGDGVLLHVGQTDVFLEHARLGDLSADMFVFG